MTAYTSTDHRAANTRKGPKRIRSATAPDTSATVMMQNEPWKAMNSRCGMVCSSLGTKSTPLRNANPNPPMKPLPSEKASE